MNYIIAIVGVFLLLIISEYLWRKQHVRGEVGRKLVHVTVGMYVAFWPYFMSWQEIRVMCIAFFFVVLISQKLNTFRAIHEVSRRTHGELLFPVGIMIASFFASNELVFTVAVLHLALADGFAAILGTLYGQRRNYRVFTYKKSVVGTLTFLAISFLLIGYVVVTQGSSYALANIWIVIWLPVIAAFMENVGILGLDNVLVPLVVVAGLNTLQLI
jgi:dolichol kinase